MEYPRFKAAAAHVAPVFLDLERTIAKVCSLVEEAARNGARLVAFPETFVPAFPVWSCLRSPLYNHDLFCRLVSQSLQVPSPELQQVQSAARRAEIVVSLGINELSTVSVGCIYNANVLIDERGNICNHHRKLVPTFYEKLTWSPGDGAGLRVCDTVCGRVGMLICGENTNPLARFTMIAQAEHVHLSTYPPLWPTHDPLDGHNYDLAAAIRLRAGAHSLEGKVFNVVSSGFMDRNMRDYLAALAPEAARILDDSPRSVSVVLDPSGQPISSELSDDEGLLYADIDVAKCVAPKQVHDLAGGYNRFDIFQLSVNRRANRPVTFLDGGEPEGRDYIRRDSQGESRDLEEISELEGRLRDSW